jgi:hypothetical protein
MFQDIIDKLQFLPLIFNFDICGFEIYGTLMAQINRIYRGLPIVKNKLHKTYQTSIT